MRIAIPLPTSSDYEYNRLNWPVFAEAIAQAGGEPVEFRLDLDDQALAQLARSCQAVLLPGSPADVDPALYGQPRDAASAPADPARERTDRFLLEHAEKHRKPLLGVCFGAQMLNVFHGGTLVQDLTVLPVNHAASRGVMTAHAAMVATASRLGELVGKAEAEESGGMRRLPVNSSHHQAVGIAGEGLVVCARCPQDAVVEAIEAAPGNAHRFLLGVQWHPERSTQVSETSRALFAQLCREAEAWMSGASLAAKV